LQGLGESRLAEALPVLAFPGEERAGDVVVFLHFDEQPVLGGQLGRQCLEGREPGEGDDHQEPPQHGGE